MDKITGNRGWGGLMVYTGQIEAKAKLEVGGKTKRRLFGGNTFQVKRSTNVKVLR